MSENYLLVVGATPTVQRTMRFAQLTPGAVNRATSITTTASGKAVNVARVATTLGLPTRLVHLLGGDPGRWIARTLDAESIAADTIWASDDAPTRTCSTLLSERDGVTTELVEEARPVSPDDVAALEAAVLDRLPTAAALCLSGSMPPGFPAAFYARLVRAAAAAHVPALVDAQKTPLAAALAERPFLVKPNVEESAATLGLTISGDAERDAEAAVAGLTRAGASFALVSMGGAGSLLGDAGGARWRITPPRLETVVNPIGSGDSLAAGVLVALLRDGMSVDEAAAYGTAVAAANCLSETSGVVDPADVERLRGKVRLAAM